MSAFWGESSKERLIRERDGLLSKLDGNIRGVAVPGAEVEESRVHVMHYQSKTPEKPFETGRYTTFEFFGTRSTGILEGKEYENVTATVILEARALPGSSVTMKVGKSDPVVLGSAWVRFAGQDVTANRMDFKGTVPGRIKREAYDRSTRRYRPIDKTRYWFFSVPTDVMFAGTGAGYEVRISTPRMWFPDARD